MVSLALSSDFLNFNSKNKFFRLPNNKKESLELLNP